MKRYEVWISNFRLLWGNLTAASRLDQFGYSSQSIPLIFLICVGWRSWGRNLQIPCTVFRWKKFPVRKILLLNYSCSCQNETLIPWRSTVLLGPEMVCCTLKSLTVPICKNSMLIFMFHLKSKTGELYSTAVLGQWDSQTVELRFFIGTIDNFMKFDIVCLNSSE